MMTVQVFEVRPFSKCAKVYVVDESGKVVGTITTLIQGVEMTITEQFLVPETEQEIMEEGDDMELMLIMFDPDLNYLQAELNARQSEHSNVQ